ncbi:unnamed protein product [Hydatigera taeniaeformis]|uniref:PYNP_C domain-containing protein n=1 Tax=Hydatigena taeniaeformis TaxID=6205 RepID=A0A0R3X932_HYDTA|nr:unnamed protein product [Hydatigera taeniaeformis]
MMQAAEMATDRAKARGMMLEAVRDGRARTMMRKMLVSQGVNATMAEALCSPPPPDCADAIDYYLEVMGKMANGKKDVKSPRTDIHDLPVCHVLDASPSTVASSITQYSNICGLVVTFVGYISDIDAGTIAQVVWRLGAGRDKPDDAIDHTVGIRLLKHVGDSVKTGELTGGKALTVIVSALI